MRMEYIILENKNKKTVTQKKEKNKNTITINYISPIEILQKNFEKIEIKQPSGFPISLSYGKIKIGKKEFDITIKEYAKQSLFYLTIENKIKQKDLIQLEELDEKINKIMLDNFIIITSYDSISEYYCNSIYSKLNSFERKLRSLLYDVYTFSYGQNYINNIDKKIKENYRKDDEISTQSNETEKLKQLLYSLDYSNIIDLLFTPKWSAEDEKYRKKVVDTIQAKDIEKEELISIIENLQPKSDWDRLFFPKIGITGIRDSIEEMRDLRNKVAHCRFFRKNSFIQCNELLKQLDLQIDQALDIVMSQDFTELNSEYLLEMTAESLKDFTEAMQTIGKIITDGLQYVMPTIQKLGSVVSTLALSSISENVEED